METKELWEEFYKDGKYIMWSPSEAIVKFFGRISKKMDIKGKSALDFGCGVGRNTFYMSSIGLQGYGIDISGKAIEIAKKRRDTEKSYAVFEVYDGSIIPFGDNTFDFVISHGVLDHVLFAKAKELMKEIYRILKPKGLLELEIHSTYDTRYKKGKKIENNIYIIEDECEKGLPQHFFDRDELEELIEGFRLKELILNEETLFSNVNKTSFWVLYLERI